MINVELKVSFLQGLSGVQKEEVGNVLAMTKAEANKGGPAGSQPKFVHKGLQEFAGKGVLIEPARGGERLQRMIRGRPGKG